MIIKRCDLSHLNILTDFYTNVVNYLVKTINYPRWTPGVYPCEKSIEDAIEKGFQYAAFDEDGEVLGAFVFNNDPAGNYDVGDWKKPLKSGQYMVIHTLATRIGSYGKGVATKMVEFCIQETKNKGYKSIRLDVVPDNYPAIKLYEKCGFVFAGEKDLQRGFEHIPTFCLYGLDLD